MSMQTAFDASRLLECSGDVVGFENSTSYIDPDVDDQGHPYLLVHVEASLLTDLEKSMPPNVMVGGQAVPIILKAIEARMN